MLNNSQIFFYLRNGKNLASLRNCLKIIQYFWNNLIIR